MNNFENEIPRHMKKKDSNVSKSKEKSKHKHEYKECFLKYKFKRTDEKYFTSLGAYCSICGKLGDLPVNNIFDELKNSSEFDRSFASFKRNISEMEEKYKDIVPVFYLDNVTDKYVEI